MIVIINILILLGAALFWEGVAWFMHKYVMHGFGWYLHKDHYVTTGRRLQKNDAYALFFAFCSFILIFQGLKNSIPQLWSAGFDIALYGVGYVGFHDIMFHKRFKWIKMKPRSAYFQRIINARRIHHSVVTREDAASFSFLWAPKKYDTCR